MLALSACGPWLTVSVSGQVERGSAEVPAGGWLRVADRRGDVWSEAPWEWSGGGARWSLDLFEEPGGDVSGELRIRDEAPRRVQGTLVDGLLSGWTEPGTELPRSGPAWQVTRVGDLLVLRPTTDALGDGLTAFQLDEVVDVALGDRDGFDYALVVEGPELTSELRRGGIGGFAIQRDVLVRGVGRRPLAVGSGVVRAAVWMNAIDRWDGDEDLSDWVFCQELGHWRLAYARVDVGDGPLDVLRGRAGAHWSYLLDTGASPMEGNAWRDDGTGTFTSQPELGLGPFSDLDQYLMGWISADQVEPFFLIEPADDEDVDPADAPEARTGDPPRTVRGARVELTVDDVIRAEGEVWPGPDEVERELSVATLLVVGPDEPVTDAQLARLEGLTMRWGAAWSWCSHRASTVDFSLDQW